MFWAGLSLPDRTIGTQYWHSILSLRHLDNQAVQFIAHSDLTSQPALIRDIERKVEHVGFQFIARPGFFDPGFIHVDMAGGTRARAAAITFKAGHRVFQSAFHDGHAVGDFYGMFFFSAVFDIGNFGHKTQETSDWRFEDAGKRQTFLIQLILDRTQ